MEGNLELYERLKGPIGEEAARVIAEAFPQRREVATRRDIEGLRADVERLEQTMRGDVDRLEGAMRAQSERLDDKMDARLSALEAKILRWMLGLFLPTWLGIFGTMLAILLRG